MPILLYRIDERLIHGQVVIGWGSDLRPSLYIVVDDTLAASEWEQDIYRLGIPDGAEAEFASVENARKRLPDWRDGAGRGVLLTRNVDTMRRLARDGTLEGAEVNVGGIHHAPGRTEVLRYVHLDDGDRALLEELAGEGVTVSARDLPGANPVTLDALLAS